MKFACRLGTVHILEHLRPLLLDRVVVPELHITAVHLLFQRELGDLRLADLVDGRAWNQDPLDPLDDNSLVPKAVCLRVALLRDVIVVRPELVLRVLEMCLTLTSNLTLTS